MIIYATGDEHLYLRTRDVPEDWLRNRFEEFLYHTPFEYDVRVHMGDFFDTMPNIKELAVFLKYANSVTKPTYMIDGNHEATKRGSTFLTNIIPMITNPLFIIIDKYAILPFADFLPYCELKSFAKLPTTYPRGNKILFTHVRGALPPHVQPEIDLSLFSNWNTVFCGDLHSHQLSQLNLVYPGSPLSTHRIRTLPKGVHGGLRIDSEQCTWKWYSFDREFGHLMRMDISEAGRFDEEFNNIVYTSEVDSAKDTVAILASGAKVEKVVKAKDAISSLGLTKEAGFNSYIQAYMKKNGFIDSDVANITKALYEVTNGLIY